MNGMALCAGAGGLELGLHLALGDAYRTVVGVEWEASAAAVLVARQQDSSFPPFPVWDSVATFDGRPWRGVVDIVSGGFPCQPFSVAGKRGGDSDSRHLWPHIARIVEESQPGIVFLENVPGLLNTPLAGGSGFAYELVESDLLRLGYRVACGLFTAAEVGAPHQRERLFILAVRDTDSIGRCAESSIQTRGPNTGRVRPGHDMAHAGGGRRQQDTGGASGEEAGADGGNEPEHRRNADVADTGRAGAERWPEEQDREPGPGAPARDSGTGGAVDDADLAGLEGRSRPFANSAHEPPAFPPGPSDSDAWSRILRDRPDLAPALSINEEWELGIRFPFASKAPEPPVRGVVDELGTGMDLSRTARLRITGNGVVPACAALAFRTLWGQLADAGHPERTGVCDED